MIKIIVSNICSAFRFTAIGSAVIGRDRSVERDEFMDLITSAIRAHDTSQDAVPGQHYIPLPETACQYVSCGIGKRSDRQTDYVTRTHRGRVDAYLRREFAAKTESVAVVVYDRQAYLSDPDLGDEEALRIGRSDCTHVLVAVLASNGIASPLTPHRLVANLAGGNAEAQLWTGDEARAKAKEVDDFYREWSVVAD